MPSSSSGIGSSVAPPPSNGSPSTKPSNPPRAVARGRGALDRLPRPVLFPQPLHHAVDILFRHDRRRAGDFDRFERGQGDFREHVEGRGIAHPDAGLALQRRDPRRRGGAELLLPERVHERFLDDLADDLVAHLPAVAPCPDGIPGSARSWRGPPSRLSTSPLTRSSGISTRMRRSSPCTVSTVTCMSFAPRHLDRASWLPGRPVPLAAVECPADRRSKKTPRARGSREVVGRPGLEPGTR